MTSFAALSNIKSNKHFRSTFILLAASTLFACNQADIDAADTANSAETSAVQTTAAQTQQPTTTTQKSSPERLKNISATVYKDINCGCCEEWMDHAHDNGMTTTAEHPSELYALKESYGVAPELQSCHTTVTTDGYVFEGHVPAKYVAQFLENPPKQALGLAVPGMPVGSPGMEYQGQFIPYQIVQMNKDGSYQVYADIDTINQQS